MNQGCKYIIITSFIPVSLLVLRSDSDRDLFTFTLTYHTILGIQAPDITTFDYMITLKLTQHIITLITVIIHAKIN